MLQGQPIRPYLVRERSGARPGRGFRADQGGQSSTASSTDSQDRGALGLAV